jgi:uncharacterized protein
MAQKNTAVDQDVKERLRELISELRSGRPVTELDGPFRDLVEDSDLFEIEEAEEELRKEGTSKEDLRRICEFHISMLGEISEGEETFLELPGHPINTLMEEHLSMLSYATELIKGAQGLAEEDPSVAMNGLDRIVGASSFFNESDKHFQREELVLYPFLNEHGVIEPIQEVRSEHRLLKKKKNELLSMIDRRDEVPRAEFIEELLCTTVQMRSLLNAHFYKENHLIFPMALRAIDRHEWQEIARGFDEIGYCDFLPHQARLGFPTIDINAPAPGTGLRTGENFGELTIALLAAVFKTLPLELTIIDEKDRVRFFSPSPQRIFIRTNAALGRTVQNCHPEESLPRVQSIIDEFRSDVSRQKEFWLKSDGRQLYIRYLALRGAQQEYLGLMEVVQDITDIEKLSGERRL